VRREVEPEKPKTASSVVRAREAVPEKPREVFREQEKRRTLIGLKDSAR